MFLPEITHNRPRSAYFRLRLQKPLGISTKAGIVVDAGVGVYPRTAPVYTIRTPSPGGQFDAFSSELPAFLFEPCALQNEARELSEGAEGAAKTKQRPTEGYRACRSKNSQLQLQRVLGSSRVARRSVSKPSAALQSVLARPSLRTAMSCKGRPWARGPMCSTANSIQAGVTDTQSSRILIFLSRAKGLCVAVGVWCAPTFSNPYCQGKTSHV